MKLERALELCQLPLDQSRSHEVYVDRYALIHVLDDRRRRFARVDELLKENAQLAERIAQLASEKPAKAAA